MPQIELVDVPLYQPLDPYHHIADNVPISGLITRIQLVNNQVDILTEIMNSAIGTQGTLANRLDQSINDDGTLKASAIDAALHDIEDHIDSPNYVRMMTAERAKLAQLATGATHFTLTVNTQDGSSVYLLNQDVTLSSSDSVTWRLEAGNTLFAETIFPVNAVQQRYYNQVPEPADLVFPDFMTWVTPLPYTSQSLRVYINGVRLSPNSLVYVPIGVAMVALTYAEDVAVNGVVPSGLFTLSGAITDTTTINVDFDVSFT